MTDKQFEDAFTSAGGWFIADYYETIINFDREKNELIKSIYNNGLLIDKDISGTRTRVNAVIRLIKGVRIKEALEKVVQSKIIQKQKPQSVENGKNILYKYFK